MPDLTCYMCGGEASSREHVPPRCIFPEQKDVGDNYRENLITVPSCDLHNSAKCREDEFLLVSLAGIIGNNSIGYRHKFTKVNRAIKRSAFSLIEGTLKNPVVEWLELGPNKFIDVIWGTPDYERLSDAFDHIARGLYYHHHGESFRGITKVLLGYTSDQEENPAAFKQFIRDKVEIELQGKSRLGANPEVFSYQFTDPDRFGLFMVHLRFYGGIDVYINYQKEGVTFPPDLSMELIGRGIPTVYTLGTREYRFNCEKQKQKQEPDA